MPLIGITLCIFCTVCFFINRWFGNKIQNSMLEAERLVPSSMESTGAPSLDIVIPAYNEEFYIRECAESVLQSLGQFPGRGMLWIADDQSTDLTLDIAQKIAKEDDRVRAIAVPERPNDQAWQGKNWACHYVSQLAQRDYILFLDADVLLEAGCLEAAIKQMETSETDLLTLFPKVNCSFWGEWLIQPVIFSAITGFCEFQEVNDSDNKDVAFACGPFMLFRKSSYQTIGGHKGVAENPVEDVALAKNIKDADLILKAMLAHQLVTVRMYSSFSQLWEGWTKNFHMGFNSNIIITLAASLLMLSVWSVPQLSMAIAIIYGGLVLREPQFTLFSFEIVILFLALALTLNLNKTRSSLGEIFPQPMKYAKISFLGGIILLLIAIASIIKTETGWGWTWRGRSLAGANAGKT